MIKVTRIGFINFWLFDDEEFDFYDGKLLLRGHNGAGKSVTMQSFIPLILDGNKSPSRLDPFGTTDKHIEDYILGGIDTEKKEEATSYLYMETYHEEKQKYITVGMGLHGRRGRAVEFYGFSLEDGRRIGRDMFLYKNHGEKIPLSKGELKYALGSENQYVETTKEYKKMVNDLLFGFSNLDAYDEFINVLLQLRSPKLSKEYKPTKLMGILSSVLQPLAESDLRVLSEAIEEMDKTKEKQEKLEGDAKQISYFLKTYNNYNEILLYQKSKNYVLKEKDYKEAMNALKENESLRIQLNEDIEQKRNELKDLEVEETRLKRQKENINDKDLMNKTTRKNALEEKIKDEKTKQERLENKLDGKKDKQREIESKIKDFETELFTIFKNAKEHLLEINSLCEELKFKEPSIVLKDLEKDLKIKIDFSYLESRIKAFQDKIIRMKDILSKKKAYEKEINSIEENKESLTKNYQSLLENIELEEDKITKMLRDVKDEILLMNKTQKYVHLTEDEKNDLFSFLKIYDSKSFGLSRSFYENIAKKFLEVSKEEYYSLQEKINKEKEKKETIITLLEEMKEKEEEEITKDEEEVKTLEYLKENNIPYVEFYKAIDFKENINDSDKDVLEQTLLTSSILSSYIIHKKDIKDLEGHKGIFLCESSKKKKNLTEYFLPVENEFFSKDDITRILESISISELDGSYINHHTFHFDYMIGFGSVEVPSKYIGLLKRKEEKLRKIREQEKKLENVDAILNNLENLKNKKQEEMDIIQKELQNFPKEDYLQEEDEKRKKYVTESELIARSIKEEEEKIDRVLKNVEVIVNELNALKQDIHLPLTYDVFEKEINNVANLLVEVSRLKSDVLSYQKTIDMEESSKEQMNELESDITSCYDEISLLIQDIRKDEAEFHDLEELLNTSKYQDLVKRVAIITKKLEEIPKLIIKLSGEIVGLEKDIINQEKTINSLQDDIKERKDLADIFCTFFLSEYNLHYCFDDVSDNSLSLAKSVLNKLQNRKDSDMKQAESNFLSALNEYRLNLNDYNLSQMDIFNEIPNDPKYLEYYQNNRRFDLRAMYQGKKLNIYELQNTLTNAIEESNLIMNEQNRKLFEEILLKTIGNKIKERIISSQNWVENINKIMANMQRDSALSFGLVWKSKEAEALGEMDTKELVRIFKSPSGTLDEKDTEKLRKHFLSKLKRMMDYSGDTANYQSIVFDVLDYRSWFEFKMTYQRKGDVKKELTDKIFSVFSGGEKAKTMYIPLFAAVSSKLESASNHALRLVALDEAFAGVDENNIKEMFGILDSLKLDYILTSQSLTGDYDTIKELAIAELLRPNNAQVVAIKRKKWNGKTMETILRKEITKDAGNLF